MNEQFFAILKFKNLLEKQMGKINDVRHPLKKAEEVYLLLEAVLENFNDFERMGDFVNVYLEMDENKPNKIVKMKIRA